MSKAFTLIELLAVTAIIAILSAIVLPNYKGGDKQLALQRSASKLTQDLRRAQEMAMSAREVSGAVPYGFGIHFDNFYSDYYILFADLNNNHHQDAADQDLETINLESNVKISNLSPASAFSVVFAPPDPVTWINDASSGVDAQITLSINGLTDNKVIFVNNAGLVSIQ
ncbi:MAG: prepilin-type N-terminal cleavage/methylation domain-containing protein [Candidatus Nealsonbacteria bacterium]|nr:prepilin-type N-terminal cleavage/methylation domain-containing protein [Candidatus Nealsonbacteria bacterium]